ncbi:MAG: GAF domain-containing protein, partial [Gemmatimonadaceae bacterium]|nr:GAF domain-containing protein [Chitinophagaceae bacterium]
IFSKLYGFPFNGSMNSLQRYTDKESGLTCFLELRVDPQFIDVVSKMELPDASVFENYREYGEILQIPNIREILPVENFVFEGMAVIYIEDVTERESIAAIKNKLLSIHSLADASVFEYLQTQMQNLLGLPGIRIGLTPFFKVKNHYVFAEKYYQNSILLKYQKTPAAQAFLCDKMNHAFLETLDIRAIPEITAEVMKDYPFMDCIQEQGGKSIIFAPLRSGDQLIGVLALMSDKVGYLNNSHLVTIAPAIPLFTLALEKSQEHLDTEIDRVVKQQFTAVQSSVEWRFTEAALEYINKTNAGEDAKIASIVFDDVYPLYGAVDIRNSSTERNQAIQQDLLEQLQAAHVIVKKAELYTSFPLLQELQYRINKYMFTVSNALFSSDEIAIHNFLKEEIVKLFRHLKEVVPEIKKDIDYYFGSLDAHIEMLYHHRREFEESISAINNKLAKFFDEEQLQAQKIFPHYFERFVTDGVDFNIYIGQSISPTQKFDSFYLKNLKMWQLTTLARAAQMTERLKKELSLSLDTTQLILAHSNPISISFRSDERKFDVDGAYNIRYEIIKKRIDKVHIKDSNERLTQPGKIAIVYSQPREAAEYEEYIEFLQNKEMLNSDVEHFELEELQGVSGLKALRVGINFEKLKVEPRVTQLKNIEPTFN